MEENLVMPSYENATWVFLVALYWRKLNRQVCCGYQSVDFLSFWCLVNNEFLWRGNETSRFASLMDDASNITEIHIAHILQRAKKSNNNAPLHESTLGERSAFLQNVRTKIFRILQTCGWAYMIPLGTTLLKFGIPYIMFIYTYSCPFHWLGYIWMTGSQIYKIVIDQNIIGICEKHLYRWAIILPLCLRCPEPLPHIQHFFLTGRRCMWIASEPTYQREYR